MTELSRSTICAAACPMIGEAARTVGAVQIQNRATVAGNIVNASPAGDTLPVWLALEAEIELASQEGVRRIPYSEFMTGYRTTVRRDDELLTAVLFEPMKPGTRYLFRKVGTRAAQAISKVVLAALSRTAGNGAYGEVRLAFGSMAEVPKRASGAERAATGQHASIELGRIAASRISEDLSPIDDVRSIASYRMSVGRNLVGEFLAGRLGTEHRA
jgi:CO/xanthine dehydrogenase FAD-binding subunit